jgi:Restriction endonuclease PvuII.
MKVVPGLEGNDGVNISGCEWKMKSLDISKRNARITADHHLNHAIIENYRTVPWSIAISIKFHIAKLSLTVAVINKNWTRDFRNLTSDSHYSDCRLE